MPKLYPILILALVTVSIALFVNHPLNSSVQPLDLPARPDYRQRIVLVPLDSRPPCTSFVVELANIAGIEIITPPTSLLDRYKTAGNTLALRNWLQQTIKTADAAIVSIDMLVHGGLLASRESAANSEDIQAVVSLLTAIRQDRPEFPIYAFSIIPRLLIADHPYTAPYKHSMLKYSTLKEQIYTFENPVDIQEMEILEQQLPGELITNYQSLFRQNTALNLLLIDLAQKNVLTGLILGQDDGQPFGLPNIARRQLSHFVSRQSGLSDKVSIATGADELALTIAGQIAARLNNYHPKIFVAYSDDLAAQTVMPYMPNSVGVTVNEKIQLAGGIQVDRLDDADFVLFVHIGTKKNKHTTVPAAAAAVKNLIQQGYPVAVVDLSENFSASETIFLALLQKNTELNRLIAYAGWNTASNAIGTAVTQATIFTAALSAPKNTGELFQLYQDNLEFLTARFLDDWYYLKEVQPAFNSRLQATGINPYHLGVHYAATANTLQRIMHNKSRQLLHSKAYQAPFTVHTPQGPVNLTVTALKLQTHLPWERTFELYLKPQITLSVINSN
ncbi:DUF4127 family protein|uniref:DUF4127 family protein n=1 Tax=Dendrosporobacter quercicolus TaxID=146817 RepID=A0A1G9L7V2_9FIRM|nr:DUF4127 family protein [Dendrosporobacter quercicolus]NSL46620.1 DUF4127 family protein [Dendrosporobacter quercicolus DSM 1736]SDL57655.1 Protein of unknown function [Dendrosporobacter quercicolus]